MGKARTTPATRRGEVLKSFHKVFNPGDDPGNPAIEIEFIFRFQHAQVRSKAHSRIFERNLLLPVCLLAGILREMLFKALIVSFYSWL